MMNRNNENRFVTFTRQVIAAIAALFLLSLFFSARDAVAEDTSTFDMDNWNGETVILEDPQYFMEIEDDDIPRDFIGWQNERENPWRAVEVQAGQLHHPGAASSG